jgi:hypothetical protein
MNANMDVPPRPSQAAPPSHFPIAQLSASSLLDQELARKEALAGKGNLMTGCGELDGYVLLGGFERGSVVGVSAEEEEVGLAVSLFFVSLVLFGVLTWDSLVFRRWRICWLLSRRREPWLLLRCRQLACCRG